MHRIFYSLFLIVLLTGCKSVSVNNQFQRTTTEPLELGVIGLHEDYYPNDRFSTTTVPELQHKIRVKAIKNTFNKKKFNAYLKASPENRMQLQYIDSLPDKPEYISLQLIDNVTHVEELNKDKNLVDYLKSQTDAYMVTSVAAVLQGMQLQSVTMAESVFLVYDKDLKKYALEINNRDRTTSRIRMEDMEVFAYGLSFFCWGENKRHRVVIRNIIEENHPCPEDTRKRASKVKKKVNYFKL
ncbi:hypothetical protein [Sinomicrobium weinanense]|uniref:Lipoprotein n=1 Tax=Sinomicrobium weinanense TaxID=2842200 RepID=A0A926JNT5_9FLAO|nr:hypothetical protein [Sinomicrobium weinanense]MBC9794705.1 hypothetical protein [Sinomicrobium weinanense]MBU3124190.1 hypothetical protein [Sinomicrobium weinanense]